MSTMRLGYNLILPPTVRLHGQQMGHETIEGNRLEQPHQLDRPLDALVQEACFQSAAEVPAGLVLHG